MGVARGPSTLVALRRFVARNRDRHPVTESFPHEAVRSLRREDCDDSVGELLVELARLARSYAHRHRAGRLPYEGEDLINLAAVVEAIGSIGRADQDVILLLRRTLAELHRERYLASPGAQDGDQRYRASAIERAEDLLAESIVCTLACLGETAAAAVPEVEQAARHRSPDVQFIARTIAARLGRRSREVSGCIPREIDSHDPDGSPDKAVE
jgi:hypothetical protein